MEENVKINIYICITESFCCTPETNTTLQTNYISIKTKYVDNSKTKVKAKVAQSCPTLCNPMDCRVHGILQARILEWVAFPSPGDHPNPGTESGSPALQAASLPTEPPGSPVCGFYIAARHA